MTIPKNIYMCHKTLENIKIYSKNWKILNPEYEIFLYDDNLCQKFLLENYSKLHLDIFNFIPDGPIKADFWRVCVINKFGGLYVDADIQPIKSIKEYIEEDDDFVTCISMNFHEYFRLNPHFILSNKNNIILQNCIDTYLKMYNDKVKYEYWIWSICSVMKIDFITKKKSQIIYHGNLKYKFLLEINENNCEYNGVIVLHNRYLNYYDHNFHNISFSNIALKPKILYRLKYERC